ncbi:TonB family protein [Marinobacter sp. R17]|uniref:energy transducer TonB family protein n=1 Tax=Marinobacter sp. R17 TaxID=2484250 RepID=UPI000F4C9978|nr:energy transducer TonB [Marinobacter sp. R17]ROT97894.1 TonB family protein [Marinobacter sp. R17]
MPLRGQSNAQPVSARLALTLSLALLLHTLILAAVVHWLRQQPDEPPAAIHFTLLAPGDTPSKASQASAHSASAAQTASTSTEQPSKPPRETREPIVTRQGKQPRAETQPESTANRQPTHTVAPASTQQTQSSTHNARASAASPASVASQESGASAPETARQPVTPDKHAQITQQKVEQDPYVALLWQHISEELDHRPVRSIHELKRIRTVRLELVLMDNGTLRQVETIESSGKRELDRAAVQSALAASPYPEPPESARDQGFRFQVELRFSPRSP